MTDLLAERLPVTIELATSALIFAILLGIPLGIVSAYRRNSSIDVGTMILANIGVSMPVFWLGLMLAFLFAVTAQGHAAVPAPFGAAGTAAPIPTPFYVVWGWVSDPAAASNLLKFIARFNLLNAILTGNRPLFTDAYASISCCPPSPSAPSPWPSSPA